ncbi:unnamed protein product [Closterium sp. NIES-53]
MSEGPITPVRRRGANPSSRAEQSRVMCPRAGMHVVSLTSGALLRPAHHFPPLPTTSHHFPPLTPGPCLLPAARCPLPLVHHCSLPFSPHSPVEACLAREALAVRVVNPSHLYQLHARTDTRQACRRAQTKGRQAEWQAGRMAGGQNGRRAERQAGRMAGGQNGRRAEWQAGRMAGGQNGRRAEWQAGRMAGGQNGRRAGKFMAG